MLERTKESEKYNFDIAQERALSEGELVKRQIECISTPLDISQAKTFIADLEALGSVRAITRNQSVVSVQDGEYTHQYLNGYRTIDISASAGLILNPGQLDIRMFFRSWNFAFHVARERNGKQESSIQIFDRFGFAVHKLFQTDATNRDAFDAFVTKYTLVDRNTVEFSQRESREFKAPAISFVPEIDSAWRAMTEVHDFYLLMHRFKKSRLELLCSVREDLARQVDPGSFRLLFQEAKNRNIDLSIFIANQGTVQIFTGSVGRIIENNGWYNLFNLDNKIHIKLNEIDTCWIARKMGETGIVTSLEVFSKTGEQIFQVYGKREESASENPAWTDLAASL